MDDATEFAADLARFVKRGSKTGAAQALGISRQDLYRYLKGKTRPRPDRMRRMMQRFNAPPAAGATHDFREALGGHRRIGKEDVTTLRNYLLHLLDLLGLDDR